VDPLRLAARPEHSGIKRNLCRNLARDELVAYWDDDDDWIGHARLSTQVSELLVTGAYVHACGELVHARRDWGFAGDYVEAM
jgi:hypothetical protein